MLISKAPRSLTTVALGLCLAGCGPRLTGYGEDESGTTSEATTGSPEGTSESESESTTESESESTTETGDGDGDGDSGFLCDCVELDMICTRDAATAMHECDAPSPCGVVNGDAAAAECVLELLIAGAPARFAYDITSGEGCGAGYNGWEGWFYILGPGEGIDNECSVDACDNDFGEWPSKEPSAKRYTFAPPAYYADCLGESASVMTDCIFNGLLIGVPIAECEG
jgi:hypothetical protein